LIGSGPDTFMTVFPEEAQNRYENLPYDKAHNEYVQILVCQGVLGLLFYLAFLGTLIFKNIRRAFNDPVLTAVLVAVAGYSVQAFFNISLPLASQIFWVLLGIMTGRLRQLKAAKASEL
jgi:putative inorganic carbon (HCO3(-)) transporter